ncbi:hypothetical protein FRC11_009641 [Ceratobasidium sp. 423]|nr:hypothetical protein FRC11_009641 [Ceratobasidium sp. 423]
MSSVSPQTSEISSKSESASEKADVTLTKGHIERIEAIVGDESDQVHHCAAADGSETPISCLPRQIESLVKQDGRNTHGHEPTHSHDRKTTQIAANIDVTANIVDTRTQRMNQESNFDLTSIFQAHKASDDTVNAYDGRSDGSFDGVIDGSFGRGYESREGMDSDVGCRLLSDLWNCQSGEQRISEHGHDAMSDPTAEFTMEENKFLEKYIDENNKINELGLKRKIEVDGHKTTQIEDFLDCISKPFLKKFPYRDPATAKSKIKPDLRKLQYSEVDWPQKFRKHILRRFAQFRWHEKNWAQWAGETNEQSEEDEDEGEDEDGEGTDYNSSGAEDDEGEDIGDMEGTHKQVSNEESGKRDINEQQAHYKHNPRREDEEMLEGSLGNAGSTSEPTKSTELITEAHDDSRAMGEEAGHPALWPRGPTYSSVSIGKDYMIPPSDPLYPFTLLQQTHDSWVRMLQLLLGMSPHSWAQCDEGEVKW